HALGSRQAGWKYPSARWVGQAERMVELDRQLPAFLRGAAQPACPRERLELACVCAAKQLHAAAANHFAEAFAAEPKLAPDGQFAHRYNAACSAAQAACGLGADAGGLNEQDRAALRRRALGWLRADLASCRRSLERAWGKAQRAIDEMLRHWLDDPDFAGVRG